MGRARPLGSTAFSSGLLPLPFLTEGTEVPISVYLRS